MTLNQKEKANAREVYETYWDSYFTGNVEAFGRTIDPQFAMIGTSETEVSFGKPHAIEILTAQYHEVVDKAERRNRQIKEIPVGELLQIIEFCDIYVLLDSEWNFYSKFRLSTLLHQTADGWKLLQQHGSLPDMRVGEGETVAVEKISKENLELRDAVRRRTTELENKNRELAIEAALEKVRAIALGMRKPEDMLSVCREISTQLQQFDVDHIRNVQTAIIDEKIGQYLCYQYFTPYGKDVVEKTEYLKSPVEHEMVKQMLASQDAHFTNSLSGNELEAFRAHRKAENHFADPLLDEAIEVAYCFLSIGEGGLGLSLYTVLSEEVLNLFKRFHQVFSLAYQRFRDIQKAEAQAREARIETSLERVRSRSMAMQKSHELKEVIQLIYEQLIELGIHTEHAGIILDYKERDDMHIWLADGLGSPSELTIPYFDSPHWNGFVVAKKERLQFFAVNHNREQKDDFYKKLFQFVPEISEASKKTIFEYKGLAISTVLLNDVALYIENFDGIPYVDADNETLLMFGKVFQQTYTRFLDLQKAEAQAHEAQIEVSLERVRSRSMGMHNSDELADAGALLYSELTKLGIKNLATGYLLFDEDEKMGWNYGVNPKDGSIRHKPVGMLHTKNPVMKSIRASWKKQEPLLILELNPEETIRHQTFIAEESINFPISKKDLLAISPERLVIHTFNFKQGYLLMVGGMVLTVAQQEMVVRFAKVFEQTYTRFLDLQKAEAQAREAEIQLALERVRARGMAMHKSDELLDVIVVVSEQLLRLNFRFNHVSFANNERDQDYKFWTSTPGRNPMRFNVPYIDIPMFVNLRSAQQNGVKFYTDKLSLDENRQWHLHLLRHGGAGEFTDEENSYMMSRGMARSIAIHPNIILLLANYAAVPYSESENEVIARFGQVFDQAYTRFLDLQKAEAQAREAKIETALEKVRSRTMGMQKSDELADVANVLFQEMNELVNNLWTCGFVLCEKDREEDEWWLSLEDGFSRGFYIPNVNDFAHATLYEGWLKKDDFRTVQLEGDDLQAHYDWLMEVPAAKTIFDEMEAVGMQRPEWQKLHAAYFSKGYLVIITREPCPEEAIFKRFAQVFDLTYTRFLDLLKAESQAREAQIENALEKVRSRSLAMQSPDELIEVAELLREEMGVLGVEELETSSIYIHDRDNGKTQCWFTIKDANSGKVVTDQMTIDLPDTRVGQEMLNFYHSAAKQTSIRMMGEKRIEWIRYCGEKSNLFTPDGFYGDSIPERTYHLYKFSNGYIGAASPVEISDESWDLLKRATSVFSFAYTRFLDLRKAKEQTREAQIELSLERIRARVTGMQESSDLLDIVVTMRTEFVNLGHEAHYFWHMRWLPETYAKAMTSGDGTRIGMVMTLPRHIHGDIPAVANWEKSDEPTHVLAMDIEPAVEYIEKMITLGNFEQVDPQAPTLDDIRHIGGLTFVMARTTHGEIGFSLPGVVQEPPKDAVDTLVRFAAVFDLAYKRFKDLQTAEKDLIEIKAARAKAEKALIELKSAQDQLVQQEKLASLGQLTAGIAHEIKNPLNFVNNFSEVSLELIDEALDEITRIAKETDTEDIRELLSDIQSNLTKILQHGTRANGIVSSMLQHSRGGSGKMEPTEINALLKEYVNLGFHGMRAGKNPINVDIQIDLDKNLGSVNLISEDFSRVVLNLVNNAFDAMREKTKTDEDYKPVLIVKSKRTSNSIEITVADNGPGIPEAIKDKILQPFFTTKKGTEGTGLGLSITHDIVKAHGGEMKVKSIEGEATKFIIYLPNP